MMALAVIARPALTDTRLVLIKVSLADLVKSKRQARAAAGQPDDDGLFAPVLVSAGEM
jgi:hypothetical protein